MQEEQHIFDDDLSKIYNIYLILNEAKNARRRTIEETEIFGDVSIGIFELYHTIYKAGHI